MRYNVTLIRMNKIKKLPKPCPASSIRAREGAGCGSVGAVSGA